MTIVTIKSNKFLIISFFLLVIAALFLVYILFFREKSSDIIKPQNPDIDFTKKSPKEIEKIKTKFEPGEILILLKEVIKDSKNTEFSATQKITKDELLASNIKVLFNDLNQFDLVEAYKVVPNSKITSAMYRYYLIKLNTASDLDKAIEVCNKHILLVESCEKNIITQPYYTPNDTHISRQWWLDTKGMNVKKAWDIVKGSKSIKIGAIDDCFNAQHEDMVEVIVKATPQRARCHGEGVLGTMGAKGDNGKGVSGVCMDCSVYGYSGGGGNAAQVAQMFNQAVADGVKVINMSWGFHTHVGGGTKLAAQEAYDSGMVLTAAAGNCLNEQPSPATCGFIESPQDWEFVLLAGAYDTSGTNRANFSSYYESMKTRGVMNPGVGVFTTYGASDRGGGSASPYGYFGGTSAAGPATAGVAGLVLAVNPSLKPNDVTKIIVSTTIDLGAKGPDIYYGVGKVDTFAAVDCAKKMKEGTITQCPTNTTLPPPTPEPGNPPAPGPSPTPGPTPTPRPTPTPTPTQPGGKVPTPGGRSPVPEPNPPTPPKPIIEPGQPITEEPRECNINNMWCFL